MRRLFDESDNWTDEARDLANRVSRLIRPIISEVHRSGASIRDMELVIMHDVSMTCAEVQITSGIERRKAAKAAKEEAK